MSRKSAGLWVVPNPDGSGRWSVYDPVAGRYLAGAINVSELQALEIAGHGTLETSDDGLDKLKIDSLPAGSMGAIPHDPLPGSKGVLPLDRKADRGASVKTIAGDL